MDIGMGTLVELGRDSAAFLHKLTSPSPSPPLSLSHTGGYLPIRHSVVCGDVHPNVAPSLLLPARDERSECGRYHSRV